MTVKEKNHNTHCNDNKKTRFRQEHKRFTHCTLTHVRTCTFRYTDTQHVVNVIELMSMSLCLCVCPSVCLSVRLSLYVCLSMCVYLSLSVCIYVIKTQHKTELVFPLEESRVGSRYDRRPLRCNDTHRWKRPLMTLVLTGQVPYQEHLIKGRDDQFGSSHTSSQR